MRSGFSEDMVVTLVSEGLIGVNSVKPSVDVCGRGLLGWVGG